MSDVLKALVVTAELTQTTLSKPALLAMESDLEGYPKDAVMRALTRCRKELTGKLSLATIIERIEDADGRPGANEAWALALKYFDESQTVVINEEIRQACAAARPVFESGDEVGARMAFRDAYERIVGEARTHGQRTQWFPSLGDDKDSRAVVLTEAVARGMLAPSQVAGLLPAPKADIGSTIAGLLEHNTGPETDDVRARLEEIRAKFHLGKL